MTIWFSDEVGIVGLKVDNDGIQFFGNECFFASNGKEYRVNIKNLLEIVED